MALLKSVNQVLNGQSQSVAISQTNQVVSNAFEISAEDQTLLAFQVTATVSSGTGAIVKLQKSYDGTNFTDVDATNAKVTLAATGRTSLTLNNAVSTAAAVMPLGRYLRFVCTTGGSDAVIITAILVQLRA